MRLPHSNWSTVNGKRKRRNVSPAVSPPTKAASTNAMDSAGFGSAKVAWTPPRMAKIGPSAASVKYDCSSGLPLVKGRQRWRSPLGT